MPTATIRHAAWFKCVCQREPLGIHPLDPHHPPLQAGRIGANKADRSTSNLPNTLNRRAVVGPRKAISYPAHGALLLVHGLGLPFNEIVQVDRQGTVLRSIGQIEGDGEAPHLSPDGRRLAMTVAEDGNWDVWIYDLERTTRSRFTFETTFDVHARWSPAGDEILYAVADMRKLKVRRVDRSDEARTVGEGLAPDWISDGSGFIFEHYSDETDSWNASYKLFNEDHVVPLLAISANEISPRISPDGSMLMTVDVIDSDEFTLGRPTELMQTNLSFPIFDSARFTSFESGPEGQSFFLVQPLEDGSSPNRLMLIENWHAEFGRPR